MKDNNITQNNVLNLKDIEKFKAYRFILSDGIDEEIFEGEVLSKEEDSITLLLTNLDVINFKPSICDSIVVEPLDKPILSNPELDYYENLPKEVANKIYNKDR